MEQGSMITPEIKAMVGKEATYTGPSEIGKASIRKFVLAIEDLNPIYYDEEFAKKTRYGGIIAPPTFIMETTEQYMGELDEEGTGPHLIPIQLPNTRPLRGGNEYEFFQPLRPDDIVTTKLKIVDIYEKMGRRGPLLFWILEWTHMNQRSEILGINHEILISLSEKPGQESSPYGKAK